MLEITAGTERATRSGQHDRTGIGVLGQHGHAPLDPIGSLDAWFDSHGCSAVLVRPDHYVYGTAVDLDSVRELCQLAAADLGLAAPPPQAVTELRC